MTVALAVAPDGKFLIGKTTEISHRWYIKYETGGGQMGSTDNMSVKRFMEIDFSKLMDLRVDYAFKLVFGSGDTLFLTNCKSPASVAVGDRRRAHASGGSSPRFSQWRSHCGWL